MRSRVLAARRRLAGVALVMALATSCTSAHHGTASAFDGSGPGAPTLPEISALLVRHSAAVLSHSSARFLADVDTAPVSATYHAAAAAEITALSELPLGSWQYLVDAPVTDASAVAAAAKRLGAPATIVHVTLSYTLAGVDSSPATHDLWWTFVRRHGHVLIADDSDMSQLGGVSWQGPWDFGPIVVKQGTSSLVIAPPADAAQLPALSADVDAAVARVRAVWGTNWPSRVAVVVPGSQAEFAQIAGAGQDTLADITAETVFESTSSLGAGNGGVRIVLNPATLATLTPLGRMITITHEVAHVATASVTGIDTPRWLVEGFAEYVANLDTGQPVPVAAAELRAEVQHGQLPSALPADTDFEQGSASQLAAVFEESWLACRLIAQRAGQGALDQLYASIGMSPDSLDLAVAAAINAAMHESVATFVAQWRDYMRAQLG